VIRSVVMYCIDSRVMADRGTSGNGCIHNILSVGNWGIRILLRTYFVAYTVPVIRKSTTFFIAEMFSVCRRRYVLDENIFLRNFVLVFFS